LSVSATKKDLSNAMALGDGPSFPLRELFTGEGSTISASSMRFNSGSLVLLAPNSFDVAKSRVAPTSLVGTTGVGGGRVILCAL
jgi:hypothetical protein